MQPIIAADAPVSSSLEQYRDHLESNHNWCNLCSSFFGSSRALFQHKNSPVHQEEDKLCPLCRQQSFASVSAIAAHVESGQCPRFNGGVNDVARVIRQWEAQQGVQHLFTNKQIEYPGYNRVDPGSATPHNLGWTYCSQSNTYDCHREFNSKSNLSAHLDGRAHMAPNYHCHSCSKQFMQLTGLLQHLERTECRHERSEDVSRFMRGVRQIGF
jgi:hypothetical protein